jgi:membrane protease YdiL (CAAX protease family)
MRLSRESAFISFLAAFYLVDTARLYIEHEWSIEIDRLFTWVAPTMLFILLWEKKNPITYLKLRGNVAKGILVGLLIGAIQGALHLGFNYVFKGQVNFNLDLGYRVWWNVIITAGFVEEIVFRGFVLQKIWSRSSFWTANFASAFLFTIAHIPYWAYGHQFSLPMSTIIYDFCFVFAFGLLEGYLLKKTNSLWACIVHHSINNFLSLIIR